MPKNEKEIEKLYNVKSNMMLVAKDLLNPDMPGKNRILLTLVKCNQDKKTEKKVEYFADPEDIKVLYDLILHGKLDTRPITLHKGSSGEARVLTVSHLQSDKGSGYSIKMDHGQAKESESGAWIMTKQEVSLNYFISEIEILRFFKKILTVIEMSEIKSCCQTILGNLLVNYK